LCEKFHACITNSTGSVLCRSTTEPVCDDECKSLYMNIYRNHHFDWITDHCCDNGIIDDDARLEDVQQIIRQHHFRHNGYRFCSDDKSIPKKCEECSKQQGRQV